MSIIKFVSVRAVEGLVGILLITFMPNLPPDAKYSHTYSLTPVMPFEGAFTLNDKLQGAKVWHKGDFHGPEAFGVYNGELYTTIHGGDVVKLIGDNIVPVVKFGKQCKGFHQEHICGRPLGFQFDKQGGLYVADAYYGIFKVDVKTGKQLQLISMDQEINGKKPKLPNSVAVANNGDIYWTDSSTEFFLYDGVFDMLADGSGRLIHYDAKTKKNTVLIDKLHFANGVRLAADESFVITSETARCRVYRYYLKGPKKGTYDIFLDGLPGLPDNIQTDGKDGFLIPLVIGRDDDYPPPLNMLGPFPLVRKFLSRLLGLTEQGFKLVEHIYPSEWAERAIHYIGHFASIPHSLSSPRQSIMHISKDGVILDTIHSLNGHIIGMSEAFIFKDMLYMGSPFNDYIARIPLEKVGWGHLALKESDYPSSITAPETPNLKVAPAATPPTAKTAAPTQSTTPPPPKVTTSTPTPKVIPKETPAPTPTAMPKVTTTTPKVVTSTPTQSLPSTKQASPSSKPTTQAPPVKQTPPPAKQVPPPPAPVKQTASSHPAKHTSPPPPPAKQTPPPPAEQSPPPPPTKQTSSSPPPENQGSPPPSKQTPPPPPAKQSPPLAPATQTPPPPPPAIQTPPPPPPVNQQPPPAPTKPPPSQPKPASATTQPPHTASTQATEQTTPPPTKQLPSVPTTAPPPKTAPTQAPKEIPTKQSVPSTSAPTAQPSTQPPQKQPTPKQAPPKSQGGAIKNEL